MQNLNKMYYDFNFKELFYRRAMYNPPPPYAADRCAISTTVLLLIREILYLLLHMNVLRTRCVTANHAYKV